MHPVPEIKITDQAGASLENQRNGVKNMYNFDEIIDRRHTNAMNTDGFRDYIFHADETMKFPYKDEEFIRMWVADMEFATPDVVIDGMRERLDKRIFGYTRVFEKSYYEAFSAWCQRRYGWTFDRKELVMSNGIIPALYEMVEYICKPDEKVLFLTPSYAYFKYAADFSKRGYVCSDLHDEDGYYTIDFDDLAKKAADEKTTLFILCNPHNPVGRVWTKEELEKMGDICLKHNVVIMDDEIHCDFTYPGFKFTSFMTLDKKYHNSLVLYTSPSKTFNVAGLQPANIIIKNQELRAAYRKANAAAGYSQGSIMGQVAVKSVYTKGDEWVNELVEYITGNMNYMRDFVKENFPKAQFVDPEGTYLTWVDFSGYGFTDEELEHIMVEEAHLWLDSGKVFGPATAQFERFNLACPRATVVKAMEQLKAALDNHTKWA